MPATTAAAIITAVAVEAGTFAAAAITFAVNAAFSLAGSFLVGALTKKDSGSSAFQDGNTLTVRQPTHPWEYVYGTTRKGGSYAFIHSDDGDKYLHIVIILADREVTNIGEIYIDDQTVALDADGNASGTDKEGDNYKGYLRVLKKLGTTDQTAFQDLIDEVPDKWTANHRLRGKACIYVRLKSNQTRFPGGVPNISAIVDGHRVYDRRDSSQDVNDYDTWKFSRNSDLCLADYLRDVKIGLSAHDEITADEDIAAANACDENIPLLEGGTEKRYTCNGVVDSSHSHKDIIEALLTAMNGQVVVAGSSWKLYAGVWRAPEKRLDESDIRGPVKTQTLRSDTDLFNGVRGVYTSPDNNFQPSDFPAVISDSFVEIDGEENFLDIELPFTNSAATAQRIAKMKLLESRQQVTTEWQCMLTAWSVQPTDNVMLTRETMGWSDKYFRVHRAPTVIEDGYIGVDLSMEETDPSIYDWTTDEENAVDPAPNTNLPNIRYQAEPNDIICESGDDLLKLGSAGQLIVQMRVIIEPPIGSFVEKYDVEWRSSVNDPWFSVSVAADVDFNSQLLVSPVVDGDTYYVRARSVSRFGTKSEFIDAVPHIVKGKDGDPSPPTFFGISRQSDGTRQFDLRNDNEPLDVTIGGGYRIKYKIGTEFDYATEGEYLTKGLITTFPFESNQISAGQYVLAAVTVDSTGHTSTPVYIVATLGDPRLDGVLYSQVENAFGWPGTCTDCFVGFDYGLKAKTIGGWAALAGKTWSDFDGLTWNDILPREDSFNYTSEVIDIGVDILTTPLLTVNGDGIQVLEVRTGIDADGGVVTAWGPLEPVVARYVQWRVTISKTSPEYPSIQSAAIILDGKGDEDRFDDLNTAAGALSATWFSRISTGRFQVATRKNIAKISTVSSFAFQGISAQGYTWVVRSKDETLNGKPAVEIQLSDSNGNAADAIVDLTIKGPVAP